MGRLRVALCQLNTVVGDLDGNVAQILAALDRAEEAGADVAVFPELAVTGYPPEDLVLRPGFVADGEEALAKIAARTGRCAAVVGFVDAVRDLHNAAAVCAEGEVKGVYHKRLLPNSGVFDEQRTFTPGTTPLQLFVIGGVRVGVSICEDAWSPARTDRTAPRPAARSWSSTSTRRRITGVGAPSASACSPRGRPTPRAASCT